MERLEPHLQPEGYEFNCMLLAWYLGISLALGQSNTRVYLQLQIIPSESLHRAMSQIQNTAPGKYSLNSGLILVISHWRE